MCFLGVGACQNFRGKTSGVGVRGLRSFQRSKQIYGEIFEGFFTA